MTIYEVKRNLTKGSTGEEVKALQEFLKQQGYFPKDTPSTGYYGDITKTAVEKWQKAVGIQPKEASHYGNFGPISQAFLQQQKSQPPAGGGTQEGTPSNALPGGGTQEGGAKPQDTEEVVVSILDTSKPGIVGSQGHHLFKNRAEADLWLKQNPPPPGWSVQYSTQKSDPGQWDGKRAGAQPTFPNYDIRYDEPKSPYASTFPYENYPFFKSLPEAEKTLMRMMWDISQKKAELGQTISAGKEITQQELDQFMEQARTDPDIQKYYSEQIRLAGRDIDETIKFMQGEYTEGQSKRQRKFEEQRKTLAEQEAEAGRTFSGFRKQAQERLGAEQEGVIQSSRRQLQRNLYTLGSEYERKFGSSNLPTSAFNTPTEYGEIGYTPYGGVPGEIERQKTLDVQEKYRRLVLDKLYGIGQS